MFYFDGLEAQGEMNLLLDRLFGGQTRPQVARQKIGALALDLHAARLVSHRRRLIRASADTTLTKRGYERVLGQVVDGQRWIPGGDTREPDGAYAVEKARIRAARGPRGTDARGLHQPPLVDPRTQTLGYDVERAKEEAKPRLNEQVQKIREAGGMISRTHVRVGPPEAEIVGLAEELNAGLVVLMIYSGLQCG